MKDAGDKSDAEIQHLAELKMQIQELLKGKLALEATVAKYTALYDTAPCGYFILTKTGHILESNAYGAQLLGAEPEALPHQSFNAFVADVSKPDFEVFIAHIFSSSAKNTCILRLSDFSKTPFFIHLTGMVSENGTYCVVTATDLTAYQLEVTAQHNDLNNKSALINSTNDLMWSVDKNFCLLAANNSFLESLEQHADFTPNIGDYVLSTTHFSEACLQYWKDLYGRGLSGEVVLAELVANEPQRDEASWYKINIHPIYDGKAVTGVTCFGRNITADKVAEAALKSSVSSLDASLESTADGILIVSVDGKITKWNQKFVRMWQMSEDVLASSDDSEAIRYILSMLIDPDQFISKVVYLYAHPEESSFDQIDFLDGRIFERYSQAQKIGDKIVGRVWSFRDITQQRKTEAALRKSEEKYRTIFENVQDVFYQVDLEGIILEISPSISNFSGYHRDEILGTYVYNYYCNPEDRALLLHEIAKNSEIREYELKFRIKSGDVVYTSINARLILDADGQPHHIDGVIRDITERKKHEIEIAYQNKKLQVQNKELEQFTYITSHDLQEPLRNLISIAALIKEEFKGKLDANSDQYLTYMLQSSDRMQALVNGLSAYSRIGKTSALTTIDCNQIVTEVLADLSVAIKESSASIKIYDLPILNGYATELRQLFQNLISNALKFRKKDIAPEIEISAKKSDDNWLFSIQDNGIGIEEQDKEKIFIIFKRLHNRNDYEGTGIGLSYCKKITAVHNGTIWVDSIPGAGSTFNFTIAKL